MHARSLLEGQYFAAGRFGNGVKPGRQTCNIVEHNTIRYIVFTNDDDDDDDDGDERMNFNVAEVLRLQGHVTRKNNSEVTW